MPSHLSEWWLISLAKCNCWSAQYFVSCFNKLTVTWPDYGQLSWLLLYPDELPDYNLYPDCIVYPVSWLYHVSCILYPDYCVSCILYPDCILTISLQSRAAVNVVDLDDKYIVSASGDRTIKVLYCTVLYCNVLYCTVLPVVTEPLLLLVIPIRLPMCVEH